MDIPKYDMTLRAVDLQKFIYYMKMTMNVYQYGGYDCLKNLSIAWIKRRIIWGFPSNKITTSFLTSSSDKSDLRFTTFASKGGMISKFSMLNENDKKYSSVNEKRTKEYGRELRFCEFLQNPNLHHHYHLELSYTY
ncbi:hypothetical protein BpHYR1_022971 [Brachionus plicatilis]|uniref:Uncharacterized protein n=1 Tax=Brachionus plicatilis TaxID=10195 RepID=A0A3M7Q7U6_BRAPC|nr:hypothetical protein BpHYR1_022971 [Brachionus plicatilis]